MNKNTKEIPKKIYFILALLSVGTLLIVFYLTGAYKERVEYNNQNSNIMNFLSEIKEEELNNYILDNHDTIIYISSSNNRDNKEFEYKLKKYINKKNLVKDIIYLDSSNLSDSFYDNLKNNYLSDKLKKQDITLNNIPNIIIIKGEKIVKVLYKTETKNLDVNEAEEFIQKNWIDE